MPRSRWPADVPVCVRCGCDSGSASYGQRGLCMSCLRAVKADKTLGTYKRGSPGGKPFDKLPGDLGWLIHNIGLTQVSEWIGSSKSEVLVFLETGELGEVKAGKMKELLDRVKYLTKQAKRGIRWEKVKKEKISPVDPWSGYRDEKTLPPLKE